MLNAWARWCQFFERHGFGVQVIVRFVISSSEKTRYDVAKTVHCIDGQTGMRRSSSAGRATRRDTAFENDRARKVNEIV